MKFDKPKLAVAALLGVLAAVAVPQSVQAEQTWNALVGAQSKDMGKQAIAFLPNELWIHAGDSITWTSASGDIHTVSFLIAGQPYADFTVGCPGYSPSGVSFDGSACVTAPPLTMGQSFTVVFPDPGNFKLVCLVHSHMTGVVHVLEPSAVLPHDQVFYNRQAAEYKRDLLTDTDHDKAQQGDHDMSTMLSARVLSRRRSVAAGVGEMAATGAGFQSLSVVRFLHPNIVIRAGETVEWTNLDPAMPHTVTFGVEPNNPGPPSPNVFPDADGALHATITSPGENVHSGIIVAAPQDQSGVPQSPPGVTRFRVTFKQPGIYDYKCELHDNLGMVGKVIVFP
jgi:plastocyanin